MPSLDEKVAALAARYRPLAARILREAIRIPADYVDKPVEEGGDPLCGLSNHEGPRMEYLKRIVVEVGAVRRAGGRGLRRLRQPGLERRRTRPTASPPATSASSTWTATPTP